MKRREFLSGALAAASLARGAVASAKLDAVLQQGRDRYRIPAVSAAVAGPNGILYQGAFGTRDAASAKPVQHDSIFSIASMTKAITCAAAMQLVEQGKLSVDDPMAKYLPQFGSLQVLTGFDGSGKPQLRPASKPVLLRHLLTHTSGFAYDIWDRNLLQFNQGPRPAIPPLMRDPGEAWEYGTSIDWVGRIVEKISGDNLEAYFQKNILGPLGMRDTSFLLPDAKFPRLVSSWTRPSAGAELKESPYAPPKPVTSFNGGGGLYSTPSDYVKFMQVFLRGGGVKGVLSKQSVEAMSTNQTGNLAAGRLKAARPNLSADCDFHPGFDDRFTFGFLMNPQPYAKGRSAGSLAWAGFYNTFYWIDPKRSLCATIMMQFLPFCDPAAVGLLREFEQAVYA